MVTSQRTDRDLERRVTQYLFAQHQPGLRDLDIEAHSGTVTVRGTVRSFYEKQLCQSICRRVAGVIHLDDEVSVREVETLVAMA